MSDQPKSTPEQRAKWREAAALKKARREAGIPPRPSRPCHPCDSGRHTSANASFPRRDDSR